VRKLCNHARLRAKVFAQYRPPPDGKADGGTFPRAWGAWGLKAIRPLRELARESLTLVPRPSPSEVAES
jgi:hypothetical protein